MMKLKESNERYSTQWCRYYNVLYLEILDTERAKIACMCKREWKSRTINVRWNEITDGERRKKNICTLQNVYVKCIKSTWHLLFLFIHHIVFLHGNNYVGLWVIRHVVSAQNRKSMRQQQQQQQPQTKPSNWKNNEKSHMQRETIPWSRHAILACNTIKMQIIY